MQVLIKTVDVTEETVYTNDAKAISTEKNVVTFPIIVSEETGQGMPDIAKEFERFIHLDNLVFYRYFVPNPLDPKNAKTLTVKTKQGEYETVENVTHFYASGFYLVIEADNCITNFPLKNVLSYDVE